MKIAKTIEPTPNLISSQFRYTLTRATQYEEVVKVNNAKRVKGISPRESNPNYSSLILARLQAPPKTELPENTLKLIHTHFEISAIGNGKWRSSLAQLGSKIIYDGISVGQETPVHCKAVFALEEFRNGVSLLKQGASVAQVIGLWSSSCFFGDKLVLRPVGNRVSLWIRSHESRQHSSSWTRAIGSMPLATLAKI